MEKNRYYCELPGDVWEEGTFMALVKDSQERRVRTGVGGQACGGGYQCGEGYGVGVRWEGSVAFKMLVWLGALRRVWQSQQQKWGLLCCVQPSLGPGKGAE